ncbi:MAG: type II secretion system protein [Verrucomicrobiota bacterium]
MQKKHHRAFTLIELLIVLIIVTTLLGLTFPVLQLTLQSSRKTEAVALMTALRSALLQYRTEYGDWPAAVTNFTDSNGDISIGANQWGELYRSLSGYTNSADGYLAANGSTNNTRHLIFMEFPTKTLSSSTTEPYSADESAPADVQNILDPWLRPYRLLLDANGDNQLEVPLDSQMIQASIAIWSLGVDTNFATSAITSWK